MQKNRKIIIVLILAILVAGLGGFATYKYLTPQKVGVYVFKSNYKAGTPITSDMLMVVQADSKIYTAGAKNNVSSVYVTSSNIDTVIKSGDSLRMDVTKGMPLTLSLLTANGGSQIEMDMDPTKIAITIPVTEITGVTNELKEGSRVNIYVTGGVDSVNDGAFQTMLLFENMRVLSVAKNNNGILSAVTIETDLEDSIKLVYYASSYSIYLGLVDGTGYEYSPVKEPSYTPGTTSDFSVDVPQPEMQPENDANNETTETPAENTTENATESTTEAATEAATEADTEAEGDIEKQE